MHLVTPADGGHAAAVLLLVLTAAACVPYALALRRPPRSAALVAGGAVAAAALLVAAPLFSADAFAYAYYGDLLLHGANPYAHDPGLLHDPLAAAATAAWNGRIPPRCVYGPVAVALAALADLAGAPWGPQGAVAAQRVVAVAAFGACALLFVRLVRDPARRVAFAWHPALLFGAAEGHNDAAMLALVLAAFAWPRRAALTLAAATLVKAPALLALAVTRNARRSAAAAGVIVAGYLPLAYAAAHGWSGGGGAPADWESPLGIVASVTGRSVALAVGIAVAAAAWFATRKLPPLERAAAIGFIAWNVLPNAYPWYGFWFVPIAAASAGSPWATALLVACVSAVVREATDAMFANGAALHGEMIAMHYLPPLAALAAAALRRRPAAIAAGAAFALALVPQAGHAQQTPAPSPLPAPAQASPVPQPAPAASTTPPPVAPSPAASSTATPNPYAYVVTPPAPAAPPGDGPQILEVALNDRTIHAGGPLLARVRTSPNVVGVEARALGRFIAIPAASPGVFAIAYTLPGGIPFWLLNKNYDIVIAAATADGRQTTLTVPMTLAR